MSQVWQTFTTILDEDLCVVGWKNAVVYFFIPICTMACLCALHFMLQHIWVAWVKYIRWSSSLRYTHWQGIKILVKYVRLKVHESYLWWLLLLLWLSFWDILCCLETVGRVMNFMCWWGTDTHSCLMWQI